MGRNSLLALFVVFGALILLSRLPLAPGQLFSADDVNFAYAIGDFDPRVSRPQPPGYPLFVLQTRILSWLRFKRPESNLLALSLLGSTVAVVALARFGNKLLGGDAGFCAAWLLLFHHSFWYGGLTSAIRPQLAAVSVLAAAACYRAWCGDTRWIYWSALALGVGAGIRPALGVLLVPLWTASVLRTKASWRTRARGLGLLAVVVLAWLVPTMLYSGGAVNYVRFCWEYLADQSALTSGLFGADDDRWYTTITWLVVWTLSGVLMWPLAAIPAWRRGEGFGVPWGRAAFLALWFAPAFIFAVFVHVADAGQALAMVPVVCLMGGYLISRAASRLDAWIPRAHGIVLLLLPSLFLDALIFFRPGWYHKGPPAEGWRRAAHQAWEDVHSGMAFSSLSQIRGVAWADDLALRALQGLSAERPGKTVVLWERGRTSSRKTAYYFQQLPVIVLSPKTLAGRAAPVARIMRGPDVEKLLEGPAPLRVPLPAGARLVWLVDPKTDFFDGLAKNFALKHADPLYYHDLPLEGGAQRVGNYVLAW